MGGGNHGEEEKPFTIGPERVRVSVVALKGGEAREAEPKAHAKARASGAAGGAGGHVAPIPGETDLGLQLQRGERSDRPRLLQDGAGHSARKTGSHPAAVQQAKGQLTGMRGVLKREYGPLLLEMPDSIVPALQQENAFRGQAGPHYLFREPACEGSDVEEDAVFCVSH